MRWLHLRYHDTVLQMLSTRKENTQRYHHSFLGDFRNIPILPQQSSYHASSHMTRTTQHNLQYYAKPPVAGGDALESRCVTEVLGYLALLSCQIPALQSKLGHLALIEDLCRFDCSESNILIFVSRAIKR